ncbi:MAG TPA: hypothetical protein VNV37_07730 [Solirubrobacteraceae bacterium]|nr:hypothetical protein [Solirubrobacteraceae bacterium]
MLTAVVGVAAWLLVYPRTPDLAAQVYRAALLRETGFLVWDSRWYGGHLIPGYSLLFPPLGALLGVRAVGAASVLASAALFEAIVVRAYGPRARGAAVWFALAALGDVWSGRVTFALGVSFALGAVLALSGGRPYAAAALAAVCAACSPVAGVLLVLAGLTHALVGRNGDAGRTEDAGRRPVSPGFGRGRVSPDFSRSRRALLALAAPAAAVAGVLAALFGEGGWEPFPLQSFLASVAVALAFLWALPPGRRVLRVGAGVYLAACVACVAVHTPMGANVERYGVLLAGPLLLCAVISSGRVSASAAIALLGIAVWTVWGPVRETAAVAGNPSTSAAYYLPVERFLAGVEARTGEPVRVEVPFTRSHWEAAWLAPRFSLARGWEKQLDERYDGVLLAPGLTAASYRAWLAREAVGYVVLPDAPLDPSSAREGRLIEAGLPYLRLVMRTAHWRIYQVLGATPLARGPGTLRALGHDWFGLRARAGGSFLVRVRYTRYFTVTSGAACVREGPEGWTEVSVPHAGAVRVTARFSLGRALGLEGVSCR